MNTRSVLIIGSGVSGLSTAIVLQHHGYSVEIWTRERALQTTSAVAAAFWFPYRAEPLADVVVWGDYTFDVLTELANNPKTGVFFRRAMMLWRTEAVVPAWSGTVRHFRRLAADEIPESYSDGFSFETQVVEMPVYLSYLEAQFLKRGGTITERTVANLDEATQHSQLIVNCSGLGSYDLLGDHELKPLRGQIVRVSPPPIDTIMFDNDAHMPTYIVPRSGDCILGGTANDGDWNTAPLPEVAENIRLRCATIAPETANATAVEDLVGLRPGRSSVRLEAEQLAHGGVVVHNYGHGGAGITLSWGCAEAVRALLEQHEHLSS